MALVKEEGIEILRVLCGSRAYGLDTPESDFDYHGVYVVPTSRLLALGGKISETAWVEGQEQDNTAWELKHFLELAIHCNPTVLETFVAPVTEANEMGRDLLALFPHVLARKRIFDAFRGYAKNQRTKMFEPPAGIGNPDVRMRKAAVAYLRVLHQGVELLKTGTYDPKIKDEPFRRFLMSLKAGLRDWHQYEVIEEAEGLEREIKEAYLVSQIPLEPNLEMVNAFLLRVRREMWA